LLAHQMEDEGPTHPANHFELYLERIAQQVKFHTIQGLPFIKDELFWIDFENRGGELENSVRNGRVTKEEAQDIRNKAAAIIEKTRVEEAYKQAVGPKASFWWKTSEETGTP